MKKMHISRSIISHETKAAPKYRVTRLAITSSTEPNQVPLFCVRGMQTPGSAHYWLDNVFLVVDKYLITFWGHEGGYAYLAPRIRLKISPTELQEGHAAQQGQTAQNEYELSGSSRHRDGGFSSSAVAWILTAGF
jgi:hypothetical protein